MSYHDLTIAETRDIAVTAAEGGIGYWATIVSDYDAVVGRAWADRDDYGDDFVFYTISDGEYGQDPADITPALIRKGWSALMAAKYDEGGWVAQDVAALEIGDRTCEIDSVGADVIVQFGVFGHLVYG